MSAARAFLLLLVLVGALAASSTALADRPEKVPLILEPFETAAGEACPFPVRFEALSQKGTLKFFSDGRLFISGQLKVRVTNLESEESIELNIPGPVHITAAGTEVLLGPGILILFADFDVGGPAVLLVHGRTEITRAENGAITNIETHGTSTDLCAALA